MSTDKRFDDQVSGWLEQSAPARLPDRVLEATFERTRTSRQQVAWRAGLGGLRVGRPTVALGGAVAAVLVAVVAFNVYPDRSAVGPGGPLPSDDPRSTFIGTWYSTSDADGGTQTMIVRALGEDGVEIVVTDSIASVCDGTPSTMTGNGSVDGSKLVIPAPAYACDDGSQPESLSGAPLQDQLRNLTYVHDATAGALSVGTASVWTRQVAVAPSIDPSPSPDAAESLDFSFGDSTPTFESLINGYSFKYIDRGGLEPATERWDPATQPPSGGDKLNRDQFDLVDTGFGAGFASASTEIPDGASIDDWVDASVVSSLSSGDCHTPRSQKAEITIDGQSGRISECVDEVVATVVVGERLYLFILFHNGKADARASFEAFAATIRLAPETPSLFPYPASTFVSSTNGYAFQYLDRGGMEPATEPWDPDDQPPIGDQLYASLAPYHDQFDVVETGLAAVFLSASTKIPGGVAVDGWVDAAVAKYLPNGCGVPRSEQAELVIDGHSGTILEACPNNVVATVIVDGRLYLFILRHDRTDARAFFDAFAATFELAPETAAPGDVDLGSSSPSEAP